MSVLLKNPFFEDVSNKELAQQLEARKKCEKKLPTWFGTSGIYYPEKLNIEQTSSEITARYKSEIVSGKSLLDMTGGFGVDSYYFAQNLGQTIHCEIDPNLSQIAVHNYDMLGVENIKCIPTDGMDYLKNSKECFDWIYLDPSRRNANKGKVFRLSECWPDVTENLDLLFGKSDNILLKTSPLLDFTMGIDELQFVKEIHVVAVKNEVKELSWVLEKGYSGEISVRTIDFLRNDLSKTDIPPNNFSKNQLSEARNGTTHLSRISSETFDFKLSEEKKAVSEFSPPLSFAYEPNAAIMKSGAFKILGQRLHLKKLHEHTHLYTSDKLIDFPGRRFDVEEAVPFGKSSMKHLQIKKANLSTRNFPISVAQLRKKFKIGDGGAIYLFFATNLDGENIVLKCSKV
ncbi:MAG: class I SAM-dependent methyltransferase [Pricia sp.]